MADASALTDTYAVSDSVSFVFELAIGGRVMHRVRIRISSEVRCAPIERRGYSGLLQIEV